MKAKNGGAAFPVMACAQESGMIEYHQQGMTLRDYFAAKAMQGFACDDNAAWVDGVTGMASCAYTWADAMLKAREAK